MLPFSKRKNSDEVELDEADLVAADSEPVPARRESVKTTASLPLPALPPVRPPVRGTFAARAVRTRTLTPRRMLDEGLEEVVAGECLATIKSLAPANDAASSSHVRAAAKRPSTMSMRPPPLPSAARAARPIADEALTAPRIPLPADLPAGPALVPVGAFVRRSSAGPFTWAGPPESLAGSGHPSASGSVAPVTAEPTVIVVRGRPRAAWVLGAAAMGAVLAIAAGRLLTTSPPAAPPLVAVAVAPTTLSETTLPSTAVTAPPSGLAPAVALPPMPLATPKPPAVVTFGDDQGVAIKAAPRVAAPTPHAAAVVVAPPHAAAVAVAPPRASASAPSAATAAKSTSGALPDGSLALGGSASPVAARPAAPPASAAPPAPEPPKKKALTPEQQLAEAQLKASMR